ncbi:hypothetical protein BDZ91DRAFT_769331 [Kalaharituber pfeilii]|nr:hypothetical protein BDZ91DRAFT_769331 [Kalaharituber pfeilii]
MVLYNNLFRHPPLMGGMLKAVNIPSCLATGFQSKITPPRPQAPQPSEHCQSMHQLHQQKKQSKWSPQEDALIIQLRQTGKKWDDISKALPGRSPISCRLHYQNYLERRAEWDEDRKDHLAMLYERLKPEMWALVANEMKIPWRAAEAMHWQLGEEEIARRAGTVPFSLSSSVILEAPPRHKHEQSGSNPTGPNAVASSST